MLGYICKYAPIEVFEAMGVEMKRIDPQVSNFTQADMKMHPNICSFAKGVLEDVMAGGYEGVILTTCCDSIRRLYDVLKQELPDRFIYILDTPRITKDAGITLYEARIRKMIAAYEAFSGKTFEEEKLADILRKKKKAQSISLGEGGCDEEAHTAAAPAFEAGVSAASAPASEADAGRRAGHAARRKNIGLIGARANESIVRILKEKHANLAFDLTCTGLKRKYLLEPDQVLTGYTRGLLSQFPCMRMEAASGRDELIERYAGSVDGVIYHTVQFCDNYSYEYAWLKKRLNRPMLALETDYTKQSYGQILTRIEAFLESLGQQPEDTERGRIEAGKEKSGKMYVMGIDSGSTSTNAVIMDKDQKIVASAVVRTGAKSGESAGRILEEVLSEAGLKREDISWIVSTGYGRVSIPFADENVTEISCHGRGAHYFNPAVRTILDIGGQDSKAIRLNEKGEVGDPTETALVRLGAGYGFDAEVYRKKYPRLAELPFDSDRKLMSTVHDLSDGLTMITKGAVDVMLGRTRLSDAEKAEIERVNGEIARAEGKLANAAFVAKAPKKLVDGEREKLEKLQAKKALILDSIEKLPR